MPFRRGHRNPEELRPAQLIEGLAWLVLALVLLAITSGLVDVTEFLSN